MKNLVAGDFLKDRKTIGLYSSVRNEVDTKKIFYECLSLNKKVSYPKVTSDDLVFYDIQELIQLKPSYKNIPEPDSENYVLIEEEPELILVPGICFDNKGNRLGYGKGYYDKFLKNIPRQNIVGLAFDFQVLDSIPSCEHDVRVGHIITESGVIDCLGRDGGQNYD